MSAVQSLYDAAAYDDALAEIEKINSVASEGTELQAAEYRVLCLFALRRSKAADLAVEQLLEMYPRHTPSSRFSPRHREQLEIRKRRVLPALIRKKYAQGRTRYAAGDHQRAVEDFESVLNLLDQAAAGREFTEMRSLASGFLHLAALARPVAMLEAGPGPAAGLREDVGAMYASPRSADEGDGASLSVDWRPPDARSTMYFDGTFTALARVLGRYEQAFDRLDASAASAVWPAADSRALAKAFGNLQRQDLDLGHCTFALSENDAAARCAGVLRYARRVGDTSTKTEHRVWTLHFARIGDDWQIVRVTAE